MARTQVQAELIATNAISGTIIADNAITATHIATNSISGTLVQDGGIVTTMIAANNVTAAKIVSDGVEHRHIHSNIISGQSAVTAASGDYVLIGDTSDSNNLKKALVSDFGVTGISSSADATAITIDSSERVGIGMTPSDHSGYMLQLSSGTQTFMSFGNNTTGTGALNGLIIGNDASGADIYQRENQYLRMHTNNTERMRIRASGGVGIGTAGYDSQILAVNSGSADSVFYGESSDANCFASYRDNSSSLNIEFGAIGNNHVFRKDTTEHMRIDSNGNVGIGTTNPSNAKLEVVATSGEVFRADANSGAFRLVANQTDVQASLMRVTAGAVSAPSYSFIGDTTTGMSRPTGSAINFVCGGTEKARVDTNAIKITHTSNSSESAGQPDLGKTTFGGIHFESGSSGTSRGITWEASDGNTQAGYVVHNNGSDGTHHGWFATNTYAGGPYCRMKLSNYGNLILGAATDIGNVSAASTSSVHSNYGDILCNASNNDIMLSDLLPGYSRNAYATIKATGSYMYFSVNGTYSHYLGSSGGLTASDSRLKENVSTLTNSLSKVKQLRGVNFTWKDTEKRGSENNIGFIAQEVETIYPELVGDGGLPEDENGEDAMKAVNYEKLVPVLVEAIKELEARLAAVEG